MTPGEADLQQGGRQPDASLGLAVPLRCVWHADSTASRRWDGLNSERICARVTGASANYSALFRIAAGSAGP